MCICLFSGRYPSVQDNYFGDVDPNNSDDTQQQSIEHASLNMPFSNGEHAAHMERRNREPFQSFAIAKSMAYHPVPFGLPLFRSIFWSNNGKRMADKNNGRKERFNPFAAEGKLEYQPLKRGPQMKVTSKRAENDPDRVPLGLHDQMQSVFQSIIQQNNEKHEIDMHNRRREPLKLFTAHDNLAYHPPAGQSRIRLVKRSSSLQHKIDTTEMKNLLRSNKFYKHD